MTVNEEMAVYIAGLIEHERECDLEGCLLCQSAENVYRLARNIVFSEVVYPDVTVAARARVRAAAGAPPPVRKAAAPRAA